MVVFRFASKDGTQVVFREPTPKDALQMMRFINAFVTEKRSGLMINEKVDLKGEKAWLAGRLADIKKRKAVMLVVESDGNIIGNCELSRMQWKSAHMAEIGIALSKEIRGKGIGKALMSRTIGLAEKRMRGLEMVLLKAFDYNERALAMYRSLGFVQVGRIPRANKEGTKYSDDVLMVKYL